MVRENVECGCGGGGGAVAELPGAGCVPSTPAASLAATALARLRADADRFFDGGELLARESTLLLVDFWEAVELARDCALPPSPLVAAAARLAAAMVFFAFE